MNILNIGAPVSGPRYDHTGTILPHSVLGKVEDYAMLSGHEVAYKLLTFAGSYPNIYYTAASPRRDTACGTVVSLIEKSH